MKLLFVTSATQLTGIGGGITHTRGVLSMLEMIEGVSLRRLVLPLPFGALPRGARKLRALSLSLLSDKPSKAHYLLGHRASQLMRAAIRDEKPDVVVFNGADLLPLADQVDNDIKCILLSQNVESNIIAGQVSGLRAPDAVRRFLQRDVAKTRCMESNGARRMNLVLAISADDALWYQRLSPELQVRVLPGVFAYERYKGARPSIERPLQVAFLAKMSWWPNRNGAEWFLNSVLPAISNETLIAHFFGPGTERYDGRHPALRGHGFVEDLDSIWSSANFTICPIFDGSGINIKLVESLYNRVPVLATPHACRGLPPIDDPALAIVPPEKWSDFLQSEAALDLATRKVRTDTAKLFSAFDIAQQLATNLGQQVK